MTTALTTLLFVALTGLGGVPTPSPDGAVWPLQPAPVVAQRFDPPDVPWGVGHRGVDLLGSPGQAVRAALAGTIGFAGTIAGRGVVVVVHGATRTTYEPVAAELPVGAPVAAGDVLGALQPGPSHCVPRACLHWGLLRGTDYLDPIGLLGVAPVRLLPLAAAPVALVAALLTPWGVPAGTPSAAVPR